MIALACAVLLAIQDPTQGAALYNSGCSAYASGRIAEAVLLWRRALLRMPGDAETLFNLRLAEQRLGVDDPARVSFLASAQARVDSFTLAERLLLVSVVHGAGVVGFVLVRRRRAARLALGTLAALGLLGFAGLACALWCDGPSSGVVLVPELPLRGEPHAEQAIRARLHAGTLVRVEEISDRWVRIAHERGSGWIERSGVGIVE